MPNKAAGVVGRPKSRRQLRSAQFRGGETRLVLPYCLPTPQTPQASPARRGDPLRRRVRVPLPYATAYLDGYAAARPALRLQRVRLCTAVGSWVRDEFALHAP